jgi:hypothetical protein
VTTTDGNDFWDAGLVDGSIRYSNRTASWAAVVNDRTDFPRVQAFDGALYFFSVAGGPSGASAMYRLDTLPRTAVAGGRGTALFEGLSNDWVSGSVWCPSSAL